MYIPHLFAFLDKTCVNTAGVVIATTGACMLWYFVGNVVQVNKTEILKGNDVTLTIPSNSPELRKRLRIHIWLSRFGVLLTVTGGALQVISNYMS
jgi:hypothetical protein